MGPEPRFDAFTHGAYSLVMCVLRNKLIAERVRIRTSDVDAAGGVDALFARGKTLRSPLTAVVGYINFRDAILFSVDAIFYTWIIRPQSLELKLFTLPPDRPHGRAWLQIYSTAREIQEREFCE
jgi:hypothetical protein